VADRPWKGRSRGLDGRSYTAPGQATGSRTSSRKASERAWRSSA
jgi:hypothetical protein